jgi:TPR repeat protein
MAKLQKTRPNISLISGGRTFSVQKNQLLEKLNLFRENPALLNESEYRVRTDAPPEAFSTFLTFVNGGSIEIVSATVGPLRALAAEFGFEDLQKECSKYESLYFLNESIIERLESQEERQCMFERRQSTLEREIVTLRDRNLSLEQEVKELLSKISKIELNMIEQTRRIESETRYRRGCEYFFGTNGFGKNGEELSRTLGLSELKSSADLGHSDAQYRFGQCLKFGKGCAANVEEGARYLCQSADSGNSFAMCLFGRCLEEDWRIANDSVAGFELLERSAAAGNALGQNSLGFRLENGRGTAKDLRRAFENYKLSAEQENSFGQCNYGRCLVNGIGTAADPAAGIAIVKRAADHGNPLAQFSYAVFLERGIGVAKNVAQAAQYYRKAMEGGYSDAKAGYDRCHK